MYFIAVLLYGATAPRSVASYKCFWMNECVRQPMPKRCSFSTRIQSIGKLQRIGWRTRTQVYPNKSITARAHPVYHAAVAFFNNNNYNILLPSDTDGMKKALRKTQTLRAGCSKAEPKIFAPPQTHSRVRGTAKILPAGDGQYLHLQTQFGEDWCTQFRVIMVTDPQTHTHQ